MNKVFIGNQDAFSTLENYVRMNNPCPLILLGEHGLGKHMAAMEVASILLRCQTTDLNKNPDFYILDKGQDPIKVEDIMYILEKSKTVAFSGKKVYLICNAEKINVQGQNKLLKLLEDKNKDHILILLCNQDVLLSTIKSRCCIVPFYPFSEEKISAYFREKNVEKEDILLIAYLCDFCPYSLSAVLDFVPSLKDTCQHLAQVSFKENLFHVFHLVMEKDPDNFYEIHSAHFLLALHMLEYLFIKILFTKKDGASYIGVPMPISELYSFGQAFHVLSAILVHQNHYQNGNYSKNDFFDLVRIMAANNGS